MLLTPNPSLLANLLDSLPHGVIAYEAVRDTNKQIVDYRSIYYNQQVLAIMGFTAEQVESQLLFQRQPQSRQFASQLIRVIEQGESLEEQYFNVYLGRWLEVISRRLGDGFFTTFRDIDDTKRAQQQLVDQKHLLQGVMDATNDFITYYEAIRDADGQVTDFVYRLTNSLINDLIGLPAEQIIGQRMTTFFPSVKEVGLFQRYATVVETGQPQLFEHPYQADGYDGWYLISATPLLNGLALSIKDISESKRVAQQVEDQAHMFDDVLKSITSGLSVLEAVRNEAGTIVDVRYVRVSQAILQDTGLTEAQLVGKSMLSLFPGVQETPYWSAYLAAFATGELQRFEAHYHYDGFDNYTDNWVTRIDENRIISIYSIINHQKRVELEAKQQAAMLQSILNSCQMPIVSFEAMRDSVGQIIDFRYLLQNEANARTVGHPIDQTTTKTMLDVLPNLKTTGIFDHYVGVLETGQPKRFEQRLTDGIVDGWFDISVVKQGDGIVVSANDQTLLRQTLQRTEQLVSELKQSNQHLEQFAYIASHDLQEPLRKIQSFGDLLLNQYSQLLPEDGRDIILRMQSSAERMGLFIRDLLAYSRLSTQHDPFQLVDLQTLLDDIQHDFSIVIAEKQAHLSIGGNRHLLPVVTGSPLQLRQLFQNLVSNALKFSRPNTIPEVSVLSRPVAPESLPPSLSNRPHRSWIAIDIVDNGIGFDEKYYERIFQLFERLHSRSTYAGTGIGLAICRKVAENHGGTILAHSQPGKGATFTVYLPV